MFLNYCIKPLIPRPIKTSIKQILKPFRGNGIPPWINVACLKKAGVDERLRRTTHSKKFPTCSQQHIYNVFLYGWNRNIALDMIERFGGHFGTESRYPFFDQRLVQFLLAVPEEQRWSDKWPKAVLRRAMDGILPELIRMRKDKAEFSSTTDLELKNRQTHKVKSLIQESILAAQGVIWADQLQRLFEDYLKGTNTNGISNHLETFIWLELWYRSEKMFGNKKGGIEYEKIQ